MELTLTTRPILVQNPYTGRPVNVAPLFDAMHQFDHGIPNSASSLTEAISRTIRHINLTGSTDATTLPNLNYDLYRLEDMFSHMSEEHRTDEKA